MLEGILIFSRQQALSGTSDVISTDVSNPRNAAVKLFEGFGNPFRWHLDITAFAAAGGTPTFRARLVGADNAALTSNPIVIAETGVLPDQTSLVPVSLEFELHGQVTAKQYYGVIYTLAGTTPTATVNSHCAPYHQNNMLR